MEPDSNWLVAEEAEAGAAKVHRQTAGEEVRLREEVEAVGFRHPRVAAGFDLADLNRRFHHRLHHKQSKLSRAGVK
jgi:hypothetical protein